MPTLVSIDPAAFTVIGSGILKPLCVTVYIPGGPLLGVESWNLLGQDHWPIRCHGFDPLCWCFYPLRGELLCSRTTPPQVPYAAGYITSPSDQTFCLTSPDEHGDSFFQLGSHVRFPMMPRANGPQVMLSRPHKVAQCCLVSSAGKLNHIVKPNFEQGWSTLSLFMENPSAPSRRHYPTPTHTHFPP